MRSSTFLGEKNYFLILVFKTKSKLSEDPLFQLLSECKSRKDYFYTFMYVLSVLDGFLSRKLAFIAPDLLLLLREELIQLILDEKVPPFSRIKLNKVLSLTLAPQMTKDATVFQNLANKITNPGKVIFLQIFKQGKNGFQKFSVESFSNLNIVSKVKPKKVLKRPKFS